VQAVATVAIQPAAALTPAQKRFNTLLSRVSQLSASIDTLEALSTQHRSSHLSAMAALQQQEDTARKNLLLYLDRCVQEAELTATQRRSATHIILGLCEALAHKNDGQVQDVFKQHHSEEDAQALAEEAREGAEHAKAVFEDLFGQPLHGADDLHTAEAVFEAGLRQYREQQQRLEDKRQAKKAKKKPAARQLKDAQQKMDANTALRTVYRQLASALHPDREPDEAERLRKTALMSEVNAAYDRKNLSELLKLQLQLAQIDSMALSRMADDKLNAMCLLLKEQVDALEEDEAQAQFEIRHYLGVNALDHISAESLARALAIQLRDKAHEVDTLERDLRRIQNEAELKRWLKEQAQLAKEARAELTDMDRVLSSRSP
jgi:hypothetical protein